LLSTLHASQDLIQAVPPAGPPLLQLPFFTPEVVQAIQGNSANHMLVQDFMKLPAERRKKAAVGPGLLTERQYQIAMTTAQQFPSIKIEKIFFKVRGEKVITPNSLCQLIVKFRFIPPGATKLPPVDPKDLLQSDEEDKEDAKKYAPPLAYAPFFARDHSPRWHIFLGDPKMGRIAVPPFTYSTFDKPIMTPEGEPTYNVQTIKMQFGAPPSEGRYTFVMHLINDSYIGFDYKDYVTMVVEDASSAEVIEDEGEISEPGEGMISPIHKYNAPINSATLDTLAGQMRALRSGAQAEDSDESDTEGDVEGDTSDTNTDTDEE
jgi:translocation protein SEC63